MAVAVFSCNAFAQTNIFPSNGNVGINTTSPTQTLEVIGSIKADTIIFPDGSFQLSAPSDSFRTIKIGENSIYLTENGAVRDDGDIRIQTTDTIIRCDKLGNCDTLIIQTNYNTLINADNSGKVGIGTFNPSEKLTVNGIVESVNGGFKFLDGTVQTTAAGGNQSSQWQNTGTNSIAYDGNATVTGNFEAAQINTGQLNIYDKIIAPKAEADTIHALKSLEVNNSLRLLRDTAEMYAEVSTNDTAVALMLQKDPSAPVVIGDAIPPAPGEARAKLTVEGNTRLNGELNVSGEVHTNCVRTGCLHVTGETSFDSLQVANRIKTARIVPLDGDSLITLGENSLVIDTWNHMIYNDGLNTNTSQGVGIGFMANGVGIGAVAIGNGTTALEENSIMIGSGLNGTNANIGNGKPNSLMVGFNSDMATFFVGPSSGINTTGNVGIGTIVPTEKLDIIGSIKSSDLSGTDNRIVTADPSGKLTVNAPSANSNWSLNGNAGTTPSANFIGTSDAQDLVFKTTNLERMRITSAGAHPGLIGIGTNTPQKQFHIKTVHTASGEPVGNEGGGNASSHWGIRLEDELNFTSSIGSPPPTEFTAWDIEARAGQNNQSHFRIGTPNNPQLILSEFGASLKNNLKIGMVTGASWNLSVHGPAGFSVLQLTNSVTGYNDYDGFHIISGGNDANFDLFENGNISFASGNTVQGTHTVKMTILQSGNVGIGTTTVNSKLTIKGNSTANSSSALNVLNSDENSLFFVRDDGNVGIGTTSPGAKFQVVGASYFDEVSIGTTTIPTGFKLAVCGKIKAKEVEIETTNWCDYVFEPEYKLMKWNEKLAFINKHKHLPGIAPGKEIETNGLKTGETMKGIMLNVEENTLDIIELYRLNEELMEIVKKQNEEIANLRYKIENQIK